MEKLLTKNGLYMTARNLELIQHLNSKNILNRLKSIVRNTGLIISIEDDGSFSDSWKIIDAGSGNIQIKTGIAITDNYEILELGSDSNSIAITDDSNTYYVLIKQNDFENEIGTVAVTSGSLTLTGTGTKFQDELTVGERIKLDSASYTNNEMPLIVAFITSNTEITVESLDAEGNPVSFTSESGVSYSNIGQFATGYPAAGENENIRNHDQVQIIITTTPGSFSNYIQLGTVVNNSGTLTITDTRQTNILELNVNNKFSYMASENSPFAIGGGDIWSYKQTNGTTEVLLDNSIDWRDRIISINGFCSDEAASPSIFLPGGATFDFSAISLDAAGTIDTTKSKNYISGFFYSGIGGTGRAVKFRNGNDEIIVYINDSNGFLYLNKSADAGDDHAVMLKVSFSPKLNEI